jgi:hypothetical protein
LDFFAPPAEHSVRVKLGQVRLERGRRFGDKGWRLWRALKLDEWMAQHLAAGREEVSWATLSAILVLARLCEPSSGLHIAEDWYRRTALEDLVGCGGQQGQ